jgi:hypothetical protein
VTDVTKTSEPDLGNPEVFDERVPRSNRVALMAILVGFLAVLAAMIGAQFLDRSGEPIGEAADAVYDACATAREALQSLGLLDEEVDNSALADRIDTETAVLREMVAAFDAADTGNSAGQEALDSWIADWKALLDARDAAAARIREGVRPSAWLPPEKVGKAKAIDGRMDEYARREDVRNCTTDVLEADNLSGQRFYRPIDE